jgi:hypothetical protein
MAVWVMAGGMAWAQQPGVSRVSVDSTGAQVNGPSQSPSMSGDGRFVAFTSNASTLVTGDTNGVSDIFVKDRQTGAVTRASVKSDGSQGDRDSSSPSISGDGRYVAFVSYAALAAGDTRPCAGTAANQPECADIYVRDTVTNETTLVSVAGDNSPANGPSMNPQISAGGRFVLFESAATNLVAGDTNGVTDIFIRDRTANTTTRVSVASNGEQANAASRLASLTNDDTIIAFVSSATNLDPTADTLPCAAGQACDRVYLRTLASNTTVRVPFVDPNKHPTATVKLAQITGDGSTVLAFTAVPPVPDPNPGDLQPVAAYELLAYGRARGQTHDIGAFQSFVGDQSATLSVSSNGRVVAMCRENISVDIFDTVLGAFGGEFLSLFLGQLDSPDCLGTAVSGDGLLVAYATSDTKQVANDSNGLPDVFVFDRDTDHDGMSTSFEQTFGLNPDDPADAALDPDNDGLTNLQEYQRGSHPKGQFKRYLAEGATNDFFQTTIDVFNSSGKGAYVVATFSGQNGVVTTGGIQLAPPNRPLSLVGGTYLAVGQPPQLPDQSFSTVVESDQPIAVERTMTWAGGGIGVSYGSAAETAISNPQMTWYFAEGATHGAFDLFYLLQNPSSTDTTATITYLLPAGAPIVKHYDLPANTRRTIWVDKEDGLAATDVSAKIESGVPIFAERAMYLSTADQPFAGGTEGAGIAAPATQWFVAEGATSDFFDEFILIGNPSAQDANVTVTYLLAGGVSFDKTYHVAKQSRLTISVKGEDPRLAGAEISARVTSTNDVPIIVERSMWWPSPNWYEGHLTAATTETGTLWAFAGGYVGGGDAETYLLVANPSDTVANVAFKLSDISGVLTCQTTVTVPAHARLTRGVKDICSALHFDTPPLKAEVLFGGTVESDGPGIVVERSTYWSTNGQMWSAGASTLLTKVQ